MFVLSDNSFVGGLYYLGERDGAGGGRGIFCDGSIGVPRSLNAWQCPPLATTVCVSSKLSAAIVAKRLPIYSPYKEVCIDIYEKKT